MRALPLVVFTACLVSVSNSVVRAFRCSIGHRFGTMLGEELGGSRDAVRPRLENIIQIAMVVSFDSLSNQALVPRNAQEPRMAGA
jgi:hypothetical protein